MRAFVIIICHLQLIDLVMLYFKLGMMKKMTTLSVLWFVMRKGNVKHELMACAKHKLGHWLFSKRLVNA